MPLVSFFQRDFIIRSDMRGIVESLMVMVMSISVDMGALGSAGQHHNSQEHYSGRDSVWETAVLHSHTSRQPC